VTTLSCERGKVGALRAQLFRATLRSPPFWMVMEAMVGRDPVRRFKNILHLNKSAVESEGNSGFEFSLLSYKRCIAFV
jgi:hypothetical protein